MSDFIKKINSGKIKQPEFIPMSRKELDALGWNEVDVLLITGDAYVDHHSFGIALIGRTLIAAGYRVGIIAQPDWKDSESLKVMGRPTIACAISSGNLDSMLSLYTSGRRIRKEDAFSPGGKVSLRPTLAVSVYSNLAKSAFPDLHIIIGGVEASMRRIAHYDYWKDKILPGVLVSSKVDIILYGMAEKTVLKVLERIKSGATLDGIKGTAVYLGEKKGAIFLSELAKEYVELPSYDRILRERGALLQSFKVVESESNPYSGKGLYQKYDNRIVVIEPPEIPLTQEELDAVYELPFTGRPHPKYKEKIPAYEMIKDSITALRGCPGGCSFCGLGLHQGKFVTCRSIGSVINSAKKLSEKPHFRGTVTDIGGPTANVYGNIAKNIELCKKCKRPSCLCPIICANYQTDDVEFATLLNDILKLNKVKHVFISSGIRLDLAKRQPKLMKQIMQKHTSGHLKVAPEHLDERVLELMRKNKAEDFYDFIEFFRRESAACGKEQYIVPYFISNFPGCGKAASSKVEVFLEKNKWSLQQVQDFIPLPMTIASAMYYAETDVNSNHIEVNKGLKERRDQLYSLKKKRSSPK